MELIDREKIEWYGCNFETPRCESENRKCSECSHAECSHAQVMQLPSIKVPDNPTNGDMIKAMFPNAKFDNAMPFTDNRWETIDLDTKNKIRGIHKPTQLRVYADWWNAPYKRGNEE